MEGFGNRRQQLCPHLSFPGNQGADSVSEAFTARKNFSEANAEETPARADFGLNRHVGGAATAGRKPLVPVGAKF